MNNRFVFDYIDFVNNKFIPFRLYLLLALFFFFFVIFLRAFVLNCSGGHKSKLDHSWGIVGLCHVNYNYSPYRLNWLSVMWSASFVPHMNHVSVSPTNGNGPTQGQRKTLTGMGIEPTTIALDHRCSTDWARRSDGSRPWELKILKPRQWLVQVQGRVTFLQTLAV